MEATNEPGAHPSEGPTVPEALSEPVTDPLTDAEYRHGLDIIASAVRILRFAPVDRLLTTLGPIETLAPVLEPTAFARAGGRNLDHQRRLLEAVAGLLRVVDQIEQETGRG